MGSIPVAATDYALNDTLRAFLFHSEILDKQDYQRFKKLNHQLCLFHEVGPVGFD